jgi:hypothetical protein
MARAKSGSEVAATLTKRAEIVHARTVWLFRGMVAAGVAPHKANSLFVIVGQMLLEPEADALRKIAEADAAEGELINA